MLFRKLILRPFGRGKQKKNKDLWQPYDEFRKEFSMMYFAPRNTGEANIDPWLTPERVKALVKYYEKTLNTNKLVKPLTPEFKKKYIDFKKNYQYYEVNL